MNPIRSLAPSKRSNFSSAALDELEQVMPYIPGSRMIAEDDRGDPIYEDVGPTPRFIALTEKHMGRFAKESPSPAASPESECSAR